MFQVHEISFQKECLVVPKIFYKKMTKSQQNFGTKRTSIYLKCLTYKILFSFKYLLSLLPLLLFLGYFSIIYAVISWLFKLISLHQAVPKSTSCSNVVSTLLIFKTILFLHLMNNFWNQSNLEEQLLQNEAQMDNNQKFSVGAVLHFMRHIALYCKYCIALNFALNILHCTATVECIR